ncbi:hypothetical protein V5799_031189 [Amblyomma americanum]|uniref:Uncharacterized protein n=1 Tax=Amblyomma americanum TaxID=6943 RepID=A0AAQ4EL03_AMBAM
MAEVLVYCGIVFCLCIRLCYRVVLNCSSLALGPGDLAPQETLSFARIFFFCILLLQKKNACVLPNKNEPIGLI